MPSTATLTSFYSFTAGTKARASEVQNNFSVFRGHLLPINPNTVAAIDNTYGLGSSEYRWASVYTGVVEAVTSTGLAVKIGGVTKAVIDTNGIDGAYLKTASTSLTAFSDKRVKNSTTAIGAGEIGFMSSILESGLSVGSGTVNIAGTTLTIVSTGRPIGLNMRGTIDLFYQTNAAIGGSPSCILRFSFTNTSQFGSGTIDKQVTFAPPTLTTTAYNAGGANWRVSYDIGGLHAFVPFAVGMTGTWQVRASAIVAGTGASVSISANVDVFEL